MTTNPMNIKLLAKTVVGPLQILTSVIDIK